MKNGINLARLMAKNLPEPRFSVSGMIVEGVSILGGKPKMGKTWLAQHLALEIARGGKALGMFPVAKGDVLLLSLEDTHARLQSRFSKILQGGPPPSNLHLYTEWSRLKDGGEDELETWLSLHPSTRLVVIDTLERIRPQGGSLGPYGKDYEVGTILARIATKYHVSILLVHHLRKSSARDPLDLLSGTMGLTGGVDGILILQRNRMDGNVTLFVTGRDIEHELNLAIRQDTTTGAWSVLGDAAAMCHGEERQEVLGFLQEAAEARTAREIASGLGRGLEATRKLVRRMVQDGLLISQAGFRYGLPEWQTGSEKG
ncbi:MAG: AAA family ATPase [Magnetococcales bacterium]|nr:AAA family ATPase [Magnetococcales bacterium]